MMYDDGYNHRNAYVNYEKIKQVQVSGFYTHKVVVETIYEYPANVDHSIKWVEKYKIREVITYLSPVTDTDALLSAIKCGNNVNYATYITLTLEKTILEGTEPVHVAYSTSRKTVNLLSDEILTEAAVEAIRKQIVDEYNVQHEKYLAECEVERKKNVVNTNAKRMEDYEKLNFIQKWWRGPPELAS